EPNIASSEHFAHAAFAELGDHFIASEPGAWSERHPRAAIIGVEEVFPPYDCAAWPFPPARISARTADYRDPELAASSAEALATWLAGRGARSYARNSDA